LEGDVEFHGGTALTSEVKPEFSIEELRRRFENGEISGGQFEYEAAVRDPFSDISLGKNRIIVTLWRDLDDNLVLPKDAPVKAAVGDAVVYAATEDHHQIGTATLMGPFFHEYTKRMAPTGLSRREPMNGADSVAADARYALESTVGEAKYDTDEELRESWRVHSERRGLTLEPSELRERFVKSYAAWQTSKLDMVDSDDVRFLESRFQ
jgi:hypothetical protein